MYHIEVNDAAYEEKMEHFAEAAMEKVREYRFFRNMDYAKEQMESQLMAYRKTGCSGKYMNWLCSVF